MICILSGLFYIGLALMIGGTVIKWTANHGNIAHDVAWGVGTITYTLGGVLAIPHIYITTAVAGVFVGMVIAAQAYLGWLEYRRRKFRASQQSE